jgi:hypothetical protein
MLVQLAGYFPLSAAVRLHLGHAGDQDPITSCAVGHQQMKICGLRCGLTAHTEDAHGVAHIPTSFGRQSSAAPKLCRESHTRPRRKQLRQLTLEAGNHERVDESDGGRCILI